MHFQIHTHNLFNADGTRPSTNPNSPLNGFISSSLLVPRLRSISPFHPPDVCGSAISATLSEIGNCMQDNLHNIIFENRKTAGSIFIRSLVRSDNPSRGRNASPATSTYRCVVRAEPRFWTPSTYPLRRYVHAEMRRREAWPGNGGTQTP
ncbi:hypothetical protein GE21DRAFT_1126 [Neurospora crassa]|uniref:Uncharacterized protein n=1 Tax=Neurospora crassa (strain ATCC 24698 / 74-OR23-1A / CBS 708.71 / DSM 1257 / FGSC 987) TaxID=367110 RepID=V5IPT1_NEUCR|nr:hypothetical protein NCU16386 [Neurospora crassa OR74A]ESA44027.1 hypothetical protein NCU16386 [Neurospora crassa OR74A]KHE85940.1 hypothetical protein GE21DRAFT_1126 [Neurospora crassa]|eukprot:XP_011393378.1 hypothetical protein NCU16386 [Neurospora crassa OR74A]